MYGYRQDNHLDFSGLLSVNKRCAGTKYRWGIRTMQQHLVLITGGGRSKQSSRNFMVSTTACISSTGISNFIIFTYNC